MKNKKPLMIVTVIFAVIGLVSTIYFGVVHVFSFIIAPRIGLDGDEDDDCDCCGDDISNDDFFEDEGYYED